MHALEYMIREGERERERERKREREAERIIEKAILYNINSIVTCEFYVNL